MDQIQAFRLVGATSEIENIVVEHVDGHAVVFWEDIELLFPGVSLVKNNGVMVNLLRDSNGVRYKPHRIKYHPGSVLDIILSTPLPMAVVDSPVEAPDLAPVDDGIDILAPAPPPPDDDIQIIQTPPSAIRTITDSVSSLAIATDPFAATLPNEPPLVTLDRPSIVHIDSPLISVNTATDMAVELVKVAGTPSNSEQITALVHSELVLAPAANLGFESTVNRKLDAIHDQGAATQDIARKVLELQKQMNDRLILIQSKTEAILTQQLELAEYPIPRLFIVLPEEPAKYDPGNWFRTKFRLHFICECGEHTKVNGSKIPNHLHLARHEGYLIQEPTKFFKKYGPFLMLMLEMIKFGTNIAGHVVPALASLKVVDLVDSVQHSIENVTAKIDYSLECIDKQMEKLHSSSPRDLGDNDEQPVMTQQDLANYLSDVEGLEGVELRQLGSFLKTSGEDNLLGNLYRMTTSEGHVKWVCRDHYRAGYQEANAQKLRDVVGVSGGMFDEQLGTIEIALNSSFAAAEFFAALSRAKGVLELVVELRWECTKNDIELLRDAVKKSLVSHLQVDLQHFRPGLVNRLASVSTRYEILYQLLEPVNLRYVHLVLPADISKLSNFTPKRPRHLGRLTFEMTMGTPGKTQVGIVAEILQTNSLMFGLYKRYESKVAEEPTEESDTNSTVLTNLQLPFEGLGWKEAQALSEVLRTDTTLTVLNLNDNSIGEKGALAISEALRSNMTLRSLDLDNCSMGEKGVQALSEALKVNSTLIVLSIRQNSVGDRGALILSEALKINSTLASLDLFYNSIGDRGAQALFAVLKTNSSLTFIDLNVNAIRESGAQALSAALKTNTSLKTLMLRENTIGDRGGRALLEGLKVNSTLSYLDLGTNGIGERTAEAIQSVSSDCRVIF